MRRLIDGMCGRYTLTKKPIELEKAERDSSSSNIQWHPRFNIAPTQQGIVVMKDSAESSRLATTMRWGLIPSWSKSESGGAPLINARAETAAEKPSFRGAYKRRRCLIPTDGFYEWKRARQANHPFYFQLEDQSVFYFAGLWENWSPQSGAEISSFTVLTTQANGLLSKYHDRMPVILEGEKADSWLDGDAFLTDIEARNDFFKPFESKRMTHRSVNPCVNNNRNEGPECIAESPETEPANQLDLGF